ncbi:alpha/beta hydrolase [Nocardioides sp. ChNu-153]|uniref:alpha/beta hydrolase n=1 Tax=unclassified Nocardioides TaxID=2615069 RepID=UPI0024055A89|nr:MULTISPECIES: alpha/beta hydrolase [unclassified Nocardioides]MDF9714779.1 alpha/beta hydrolase [Nocardioides sp. ChNu-99]MDN7120095.1 alpha/beta hydrolase [Nocardioides sp. ChNu-153]
MHPDDLMPHLDLDALVDPHLVAPPPVEVLPGARSHLHLRYAVVQGWRPLQLDLHLPAVPGEEGRPWPVVVHVHGGSFLAGVPAMGPWVTLPARGVAVASVSYRLAGEAPFPAAVEDVRAAVAWVADNADRFGLDPGRVALWGSSAGGYLAALVGITGADPVGRPVGGLSRPDPSPWPRVAAVVAQHPVTDPAALRADAEHTTPDEVDALEAVMARFFDQTSPAPTALEAHLARRREAGHDVPPFLVAHGDADRRVGLGQSRRLIDALHAHGVPAELVVVPGADHGAPEFSAEPLVARVLDFLTSRWDRGGAP